MKSSLPTKQMPVQHGCGATFATAYKGRVTPLQPESYGALISYINTYSYAAKAVIDFLCKMVRNGGDDRLAVYLMLCPSTVPADIMATPVWKDMVLGETNPITQIPWDKFSNDIHFGRLWKAYAELPSRSAETDRTFKEILDQYAIKPPSLTKENYQRLMRNILQDTMITPFATHVSGVVSSFLSMQEQTAQMKRDRQSVIEKLMTENPGFFNPFQRYFLTLAAQQSADDYFKQLRMELKAEEVSKEVIRTCQWRAILLRPDITAWQPTDRPDEEFLAQADAHPKIVERFVKLMPESVPNELVIPHQFRRLASSKSSAQDLANDKQLITRILSLHQTTYGLLTAEQLALITPTKRTHHDGWVTIVKESKKNEVFKTIVQFVVGPVRDFCASMKTVRVPEAPAPGDLSPLLSNNVRYGWEELAERPADAPTNAMYVRINVPAHQPPDTDTPVLACTTDIRVRGHIPGIHATLLPEKLNVTNGASQFLPQTTLPIPGDPKRKIFFKNQALRLAFEKRDENAAPGAHRRLFGIFSATAMAELPENSARPALTAYEARKKAREEKQPPQPQQFKALAPGEKVAVVHITPGGMSVATVTLFRKVVGDKLNPTGLRQINLTQIVNRRDKTAYTTDDSGKLRLVHNQGVRKSFIAHFTANHLEDRFIEHGKRLAKGFIPAAANADHMKSFGRFKTNAGKQAYRDFARRIADICAQNGVGHVVVGGAGFLTSPNGNQHNTRAFYTLANIAGRLTPQGYLPHAIEKVGARIYATTATPARIIVKDWKEGTSKELHLGLPLHDETTKDGDSIVHTPVAKGRKTLLLDPRQLETGKNWLEASQCYVTNASWAILLGWYDKEFKTAAQKLLQGAPLSLPKLNPVSIPHYQTA